MKIYWGIVKRWMHQYKGFSAVLILQFLCLAVLIGTCLRKTVSYELDSGNLIAEEAAVETDAYGMFHIAGGTDEESFARWSITSDKLYMPKGVYELEVNYRSELYDMEHGGGSCEDRTGVIQLTSENNALGFQYNDISLTDGRTHTSDRVWVRSLTGIDDMEVKVCFFGMGDLYLSDIVIRELSAWRVVCLIGWLLAFIAMDVGYLYFFTKNTYRNKLVVAGLLATIVFSSLPLFTDFLFDGHDLAFHMARIWSLAEGIQNGRWIVSIQSEMLNGYGYTSPLFYGQLFLYIPAVLYVVGVPIQAAYQIYAFLVNAGTCLICYYCIKGLLKDKNLAVLGAALYTLSAYRLTNVYVRAAVGEYTAMVFFPLIVYGFAKVYIEESKKMWEGVLWIVLGLSGVIQSHLLSCELSAIVILAFCILYIRKTLQPKRLLALASAALLTLAVNLAFILPLLQSMQMDIEINNRVDRIQDSGAYLMQILGIFMPVAGQDTATMYHEMPISIGFSLVAGMGIFLWCCVKKYDWGITGSLNLRIGAVCSGFTIACIVLSTKFFPWDSIKDLSEKLSQVLTMIQFPWRYLAIATATGLFAAVVGVKLLGECRGTVYRRIAGGILIGFALLNAGRFYMEFGYSVEPVHAFGYVEHDSVPVAGGEYLPADTKTLELNWRKVVTDEAAVTIEDYDYTDGVTVFGCKNMSDEEKTVEIPLLNYDNYHARDMVGGTKLEIRNGQNNFVNVVIPPRFAGTIQVKYEIPFLWKVSYAVSAVAVVSIIFGYYFYNKRCRSINGSTKVL